MTVNTHSSEASLHRWVQDRLSAYIDDELSASEKGLVEGHLAQCAQCADDLRTLRQTVSWVRALPTRPVPRSFTIPAPAPMSRRFTFDWLSPYFKASAAAAAVLLVITLCVDVVRLAPSNMRLVQAPMGAPASPVVAMTAYPATTPADQASPAAVETAGDVAPAERVAEETTAPQPFKSEAGPAEREPEASAGASLSAEGATLLLQAGRADEEGQIAAAPPAPAVKPQAEGLGAPSLAAPEQEMQAEPAPVPMLRQAAPPPVLPQAKPPQTEEARDVAQTVTASSGTARPSPTVASIEGSPTATVTLAAPAEVAAPSPTAEPPPREGTAAAISGQVAWRLIQGVLLLTLIASVSGVLLLRRR